MNQKVENKIKAMGRVLKAREAILAAEELFTEYSEEMSGLDAALAEIEQVIMTMTEDLVRQYEE